MPVQRLSHRDAAGGMLRIGRALISSLIVSVILLLDNAVWAEEPVGFMRDVVPILTRRCEGCHGVKHADAGFRVDSFEHLMASAATDSALVLPGDAEGSELYQRLTTSEEDLRMPQEDDPLTAEQTDVIRRWIADGAKFDGADPSLPLRRQRPPRNHPLPPGSYRRPVPITAIVFSPDGDKLATSGYHEVLIWEAESGRLHRRITSLPERIDDLAFSRDGRHLLVGGGSPGDYGELTLVDPQNGEKKHVLGTFEDVVLGVAFSRDGSRAAAGSADHSVRVYDVDGDEHWEKRVHSDWVTAVSFSHDDRFLASSSKDKTVKVFDVTTGELFTTYTGHKKQFGKHAGQHEVYDVVFSSDTLLACTAGTGDVARLWNPVKARDEGGTAADMELRFSQEGHTRYVEHGSPKGVLALDLKAGNLFCACRDGRITQHDVQTLEQVRVYDAAKNWIFSLDHNVSTHRLATGCYDGTVQVWDTTTGQLLHRFTACPVPPGGD